MKVQGDLQSSSSSCVESAQVGGARPEVPKGLQRRQAVGNCIGGTLQEGQVLPGVWVPWGQLSGNNVKTTGHLIWFCPTDYCNWMTDGYSPLLFNWCWRMSWSVSWFTLPGSYLTGKIIYLRSQAELSLPFGCLKSKTKSNQSQMPGHFKTSAHFMLHCLQRYLKCYIVKG